MGKPPIDPEQRKDFVARANLTQDEGEALKAMADSQGLGIAAYVRQLILKALGRID